MLIGHPRGMVVVGRLLTSPFLFLVRGKQKGRVNVTPARPTSIE